ncbi:MAG: PqqD family protein [Thermoleophilia bacterium]
MSDIGPATVVKQSSDVIAREINGQLVILTPSGGTVHELDELGCFIWEYCAEPASVEALTAKIVAEYDVDEAVAQKDLTEFLAKLIDAGAVTTQ